MMQSTAPRRLGEILEDLVERLGIRRRLDEAMIVETWAALAGAEINAATESAWMHGRRLFVKITSPARRQQLHMSRTEWRRRLNEKLGREIVDAIVFR